MVLTGTPATIKPLPLFGYLDLWSGPLPARRREVFGPIRAREQSSPIQTLRHFENEFCQALKERRSRPSAAPPIAKVDQNRCRALTRSPSTAEGGPGPGVTLARKTADEMAAAELQSRLRTGRYQWGDDSQQRPFDDGSNSTGWLISNGGFPTSTRARVVVPKAKGPRLAGCGPESCNSLDHPEDGRAL